jgi:hypothetical protein
MSFLWLIQAAAAFVFGAVAQRVLWSMVWPRVRYKFWLGYFRVYFYIRYGLPMDLFLLWPRLYRAVREVF